MANQSRNYSVKCVCVCGRGGGGYYSYIRVLPAVFLLKISSFQDDKISRAKHEYMNIHHPRYATVANKQNKQILDTPYFLAPGLPGLILAVKRNIKDS